MKLGGENTNCFAVKFGLQPECNEVPLGFFSMKVMISILRFRKILLAAMWWEGITCSSVSGYKETLNQNSRLQEEETRNPSRWNHCTCRPRERMGGTKQKEEIRRTLSKGPRVSVPKGKLFMMILSCAERCARY